MGLLAWLLALVGACAATTASAATVSSAVAGKQIVVLGELHGTWESPAFTQRLVTDAIARGQTVLLGIESDDGLASAAKSITQAQQCDSFLALPFWSRQLASQDGRSSEAMAKLWCWAIGYPNRSVLGVMGIDHQYRETSLKEFERQIQTLNPDLVVFLVGSWHAKKEDEAHTKRGFVELAIAHAPTHTVQRFSMAHGGGAAWNCSVTCGVHRTTGLPLLASDIASTSGLYAWRVLSAENMLGLVPKLLLEQFDGIYWFEHVSASGPRS